MLNLKTPVYVLRDFQNKTILESIRKDFQENGWICVDPQIPDFDSAAETLIRELNSRCGSAPRVLDGWRFCRPARKIAEHRSILFMLKALYGRSPVPFQTLNFSRGTQQPAHSDTIHFHTSPPGWMAGVWIAFEDTDEENGPLFVCPGSHRLPCYHMQDFGLRPDYADYGRYEEEIGRIIQIQGWTKTELHLKKGQAVVWSANLLHGGAPVKDASRTRYSQASHYFFSGCEDYYVPMHSDPAAGKLRFHPSPGFTPLHRFYPYAAGIRKWVKNFSSDFRNRGRRGLS